jgi:two-component system nitrogen regulation sensor histidine kinase NtrY
MAELPSGLDERRRPKGQPHPLYRVLKDGAFGAVALALLALLGLAAVTLYRPGLSGPAYLALLDINVVLLVFLVLYIGRKLLVMFLDRRGRLAGGRLHVRLLGIFSFLAVVPALSVALLAVYLLNQGIESWFSGKVTGALEGSLQVAQAYLDEHQRGLLLEVENLGRDPVWQNEPLLLEPNQLRLWLGQQAVRQNLDELAVVDSRGTPVAVGGGIGPLSLPGEALAAMTSPLANPVAFRDIGNGRLMAMAPLRSDLWLVGEQTLNPAVLARVDQTNAAYREYFNLRAARDHIRWLGTLFLALLGLGALAGASWTGIGLANRIVRPVTALVHATNRVSAGDFEIRLTPRHDDELGVLTQAFNRMSQQLLHSRDLLERKNRELDERRRQMEAVLTGVSAGVLRVNEHGLVTLANNVAQTLLGLKTGLVLSRAVPALGALAEQVLLAPHGLEQHEVKVEVAGGGTRTLLARLVPQYVEGGKAGGVILTFDDITPLIGAQRLAAWRDVARRLAHEIKNPLTPIKLSAERLKKKYLAAMPEKDQPLFGQLTDTIVAQAEDMRRMTNEFSDFARMPTAARQEENLLDIVEQAVVLQRAARGGKIEFITDYKVKPDEATVLADRGQLNQVLVNVIENAVNAIEERVGNDVPPGRLELVVKKSQPDKLSVTVLDNGRGLPADVEEDRLFDPYVTTRKGGTGLGLAIVRRVMDEHEGEVRLRRRQEGGTAVELTFARQRPPAEKT